jgi:ADP-heptose:LPS heptosyltransferase
LINLQYGSVEDELKKIDKEYGWKIENPGDIDITNDMNDLAELISTCDIVVTCSNVTAHVAGVLGKKTLLILPKYYGRLWFWDYDEKKYSYWYPSVKIIINEMNKWEDVFEMMNSALNSIEYEN